MPRAFLQAVTSNGGVARFRLFVLVSVVALTALVIVAVATLSIVGSSSKSTPALTTIGSVAVPVLVALVALLRTEQVNEKVDGHMARLTAIATEAAARTGDPELADKAAEAERIVRP